MAKRIECGFQPRGEAAISSACLRLVCFRARQDWDRLLRSLLPTRQTEGTEQAWIAGKQAIDQSCLHEKGASSFSYKGYVAGRKTAWQR
jgi:hypothetical protein